MLDLRWTKFKVIDPELLLNIKLKRVFAFRYWINITGSASVAIGILFDLRVWYYAKDLVIFDKEE